MPFLAAPAFWVAVGGATYTVSWGAIIAAAVQIAAVAYSAQQAKSQKKKLARMMADMAAEAQGRTITAREPTAARRIIYGKVRVGGTIVYMATSGGSNEYLHLVIAVAGHECNAIDEIYFDDQVVPLDGSGDATGDFAGFVRVKKHLGSTSQTADSDLVTDTGGAWSTNHRLRGVAYIYVRLKWDADMFPNGMPNISCVVQGRKVVDTRSGTGSTPVYTENAACCLADYMHNYLNIPWSNIDIDELDASINVCEESVVLADASTETRYTTNGTVATDTQPPDILDTMAGAMAGKWTYIGGKFKIIAGYYRTPTVTLDEDDLRAGISLQTKLSRRDTCNAVKGIFSSPINQWQPADFPPITNSTYETEDGERIWRDIQLFFTTSPATSQRIAKIELEKARQGMILKYPCKLTALEVQAGDVVLINNTRLGFSAKPFEVMKSELAVSDADTDAPSIGVDLELRETAEGVWDWADGEETEVDLAPNTTLPDPRTVAAPTSLTLTSGATTVIIQPDGTAVPRLKVAWTAPTDQFVLSGGQIEVQYKTNASGTWLPWASAGATSEVFVTDVQSGVAYVARVRSINIFGVSSAWVTSSSHTVVGDATAPAAPTGLTATAGTGKLVSLDWADNTEADFFEYGIYRNTVNTFGTSVLIARNGAASRFNDAEVATGTQYYYWITAFDSSGNQSSASSSANATPSAVTGGGANTTPPSDPTAATLSSHSVYQSSDGTSFARLVVSVPGLPTDAYWQNLLITHSISVDPVVVSQLYNASTVSYTVDRLVPGQNYYLFTQAFNEDGVGSNLVATSPTNDTMPSDTSAPATPTGLTVLGVGPGALVELDWDDNTEVDFSEYAVYRNTSNTSVGATKIAEQRASHYIDGNVSTGTAYYYFLKAIDRTENASAFTASVTATPVAITDGEVNTTAPTAPTAATFSTSSTYTTGDGSTLARLVMSIPALPAGAKYQNILYRKTGATGWQISEQKTNTSTETAEIDDLGSAVIYDVATQAWSAFGIPSAITTATGSPFTMPTDTGAPNAPTSVASAAYAGYNEITWVQSSSADRDEYKIYRFGSNTPASATVIGRTAGTSYSDSFISAGATYFYWVTCVDASENESVKSSATTLASSLLPLTAAVPSSPSASSKTGEGVYTAGDGTNYAYMEFSILAMPSNAKWQNLVYRRTTGSEWMIANQLQNTGTATARLEDLTCGETYYVGVQAFSGAGGSSVTSVTSSPFVAPVKTSASDPTSVSSSISGADLMNVPPVYTGSGVNPKYLAGLLKWTAPSDKDVKYYQVRSNGSATIYRTKGAETFIPIYAGLQFNLVTENMQVRTVNTTDAVSNWVTSSSSPENVTATYGPGTISDDDRDDVKTSGIKTGDTSASSVRQVLCSYTVRGQVTLTGGSPTENFNISLSNRGFTVKPDACAIQFSSFAVRCFYLYSDGSTTSTNAVMRAGIDLVTNIPASTYDYQFTYTQYA